MTSNQIAYASAVETERHNKMMEDENSRHNIESERLSGELNAIQQQKVEYEAQYNSDRIGLEYEKLSWQKQYDSATLEQRQEIAERELAIKQQLADLDEQYKTKTLELEQRETDIKQFQAFEDANYKRNMAYIESYKASTQAMLSDKKIEYDRYAQLENNALSVMNLTFEREKLYALQQERMQYKLIDTQIEQAKLNLADKQYQLELVKWGTDYANAVRDLDIKQQNANTQSNKVASENFGRGVSLGLDFITGGLSK